MPVHHNKIAEFRFYAELNDFLPQDRRQIFFRYPFSGTPTIKDAIEGIGIPHPEIDLILVNGQSVSFEYHLKNKDTVSVYPVFELFDISSVTRLRSSGLREIHFIADVNLGKLARKLRLLGFDTYYSKTLNDPEIVEKALKEKRVIITRDKGLLKHKMVTHGYWVRSQDPDEQVKEVMIKFDLFNAMTPFRRCLECNGRLEPVPKKKVLPRLPKRTRQYFDTFYQCHTCQKVYWQGSHYQRMMQFINRLQVTIS